MLSWKHFESGNLQENDCINLGMHEFAHAMMLEDTLFPNSNNSFFDSGPYQSFLNYWKWHKDDIQSGKEQYFRDYADTSVHEFFAVATEYFFENPAPFKENLPELYDIFVILYNQDPLQLLQPRHYSYYFIRN